MAESAFVLFYLDDLEQLDYVLVHRMAGPWVLVLGDAFGSPQCEIIRPNCLGWHNRIRTCKHWFGIYTNFDNVYWSCFCSKLARSQNHSTRKGRTFFTSSIARAVLIVSTVLTIFEPLVIFLVLPMVAWSWVPAHSKWLPSGMTPAAAQAYEDHQKFRQTRTCGSRTNPRRDDCRGKLSFPKLTLQCHDDRLKVNQ